MHFLPRFFMPIFLTLGVLLLAWASADAALGNRSCLPGLPDVCEGNTGNIGKGACRGDFACIGNSENIGPKQCKGEGACQGI